ncbi:MAG: hypothetical protein ACD_79C00764G0001 [uncultured bacterium]|nr:MAG: hypothetical protein ACD_79C00764G0001 [uncultured bacterium]
MKNNNTLIYNFFNRVNGSNFPFVLYFPLLILVIILIFPYLMKLDPFATNPSIACSVPSIKYWLGTDEVGRDIFSRIIHGSRITIFIGIITAVLSCLIGTIIGLISGYFEGKTDLVITQVVDIALAFPSLLLAIGISIILSSGVFSVIIAITISGWAGFARLLRSHVLVLKKADYILAAKALGSSHYKIILKHIIPNSIFLIIVSCSLRLGSFMLAEAGLSFLGLGVPAPYPTLGGMISSGRDYLLISPWMPLIPGLVIGIIVLLCNIMGDEIQKIYDPKGNELN